MREQDEVVIVVVGGALRFEARKNKEGSVFAGWLDRSQVMGIWVFVNGERNVSGRRKIGTMRSGSSWTWTV